MNLDKLIKMVNSAKDLAELAKIKKIVKPVLDAIGDQESLLIKKLYVKDSLDEPPITYSFGDQDICKIVLKTGSNEVYMEHYRDGKFVASKTEKYCCPLDEHAGDFVSFG